MKTLVLQGSNNPLVFDLNPGLNKVGRNPTNDIRVSEPSVSSFHCEIVVDEDKVSLRDLASTNGTFLDGKAVEESQVQTGQAVQFGSVEFIIAEKEVTVMIPQDQLTDDTSRKPPVMFSDGTPACSAYPENPAVYECRRCKKYFCRDAVRSVKISGGESLLFGHKCHGPCELEERFDSAESQSTNFFGRLTQTILLRKP